MPATVNVFSLSDSLVEDLVRVLPVAATMAGVPGHDDRWDDYSAEGCATLEGLLRTWQTRLEALPPADDGWEKLAQDVMAEYLRKELNVYDHQDHLLELNSIDSPVQGIRQVFDVMDKSTVAGWENVATRLETVDRALQGYQARLETALRSGHRVARRQAEACIRQSRVNAGPSSSFADLPSTCDRSGLGTPALRQRLERGAAHARRAYGALADYLETSYLPHAGNADAVGAERYQRCAFRYLGTRIDAEEAYRWGWEELRRIEADMQRLSTRIDPHRTLAEVLHSLHEDPTHCAPSPEAFVEIMLARQQQAMQDLNGTHFDIPESIRPITVNLAPPGGPLGAYYIPPTEDFSRAGSVWYSLGDRQVIPLFEQISTAYHEGFPGHHLQCGTQVALAGQLSRLHRLFVWYSGYGEGWALYTERLMQELGYFEIPEYELGMWSQQLFRAARVVVDIGCHLQLSIPKTETFHPGETWNYDLAVDFMQARGGMPADRAVSEITRYLGWPAQAICYKLGERAILQLRDDLHAQQGSGFNLKAFHHRVLDSGAMGLDLLRARVLAL